MKRAAGCRQAGKRVPLASLLVGIAVILLAGCGSFFNPSSSSSGGSGSGGSGSGSGGSGSGLDDVYVANSNLSLESIASFSLSSTGTLSSLSGSPSSLGSVPISFAMNPAGTLLWVGTGTGAIYVYVIQSNGTLALGNSNSIVASVLADSMQVDPSGQWLLVSSDSGGTTGPVVSVYEIDQSNGTLTQPGQPIALDTGSAFQLKFAPNGTNVFAALGTGGVDSLLFTPSTGELQKLNVLLSPSGTDYADQALAIDPSSKYLYVAETGINAVRAFNINAAQGTLTAITGSPFATGLGPISLLIDSTGSYLYAANSTDGTISAFTIGTAGALTPIAGSPFKTGSGPESLAEDATNSYLIAACINGTPDLQVFSIAGSTAPAPGALAATATASTGSVSPAGAIAVAATP